MLPGPGTPVRKWSEGLVLVVVLVRLLEPESPASEDDNEGEDDVFTH
jgi:hypothetical protein